MHTKSLVTLILHIPGDSLPFDQQTLSSDQQDLPSQDQRTPFSIGSLHNAFGSA